MMARLGVYPTAGALGPMGRGELDLTAAKSSPGWEVSRSVAMRKRESMAMSDPRSSTVIPNRRFPPIVCRFGHTKCGTLLQEPTSL